MNHRNFISQELVRPRWLVILREHAYDVDRIADRATRDYVLSSARASGIELPRGDRGTYSTREMHTNSGDAPLCRRTERPGPRM